ncbi:uncharacterized protein LOC122946857 [Bufo gargarizans]|uniref:uncharacterized protein LOC122946856 n=1 Tax=Bufo gargarizans TaxID=30331 RepID=UPI001CF39CDC|nr:uncharacterized protein LOC122946856 [Bufo gargarizans]XP_044162652.1 uncharacterized protein LOC122946856 [Bufo gargarizans]XP_044162653.1 uncharacterized protein LOC122946857 [Bufo gargarizans]XP_044162654.1 uncharacterized protein LOC122946857 [Bufo gargarizans]
MTTFAYDLTAAEKIVSEVTVSSDFLHVPHNEYRTRDWERESKKQISSELHCATLAEYYKHKRIPRGLRVHLRPTLFPSNTEYCTKFENIINKCSLDIIVLSIEYLQKAIQDSKEKLAAIESQLLSTTSTSEWSELKKKTDKILDEHRKYLENTKRTKFIRDTEDYQLNKVYRWQWQDSRTGYGYTPYTGYASSSSGSERSTTYRSQRFFPRRGYRQRRRNTYAEDEVPMDPKPPGIQTRSQVK